MAKRRHDGELWLRQAADDFRFARLAVERKFFAQACFVAQQVGGKAAKAVPWAPRSRLCTAERSSAPATSSIR